MYVDVTIVLMMDKCPCNNTFLFFFLVCMKIEIIFSYIYSKIYIMTNKDLYMINKQKIEYLIHRGYSCKLR